MAQSAKKKGSKEIIKIVAIVIIFGVMGFLIFNNFINKPAPEITERPLRRIQPNAGIPVQQVNEIEDLENMQLYLDSLVKIGDWPVEFEYESVTAEYGRGNPFLPIE